VRRTGEPFTLSFFYVSIFFYYVGLYLYLLLCEYNLIVRGCLTEHDPVPGIFCFGWLLGVPYPPNGYRVSVSGSRYARAFGFRGPCECDCVVFLAAHTMCLTLMIGNVSASSSIWCSLIAPTSTILDILARTRLNAPAALLLVTHVEQRVDLIGRV
jgi:hypothetical protein